MLIATNITSLIATSSMLLFFFYFTYSLNDNKNYIKFIGSFILTITLSITCYLLSENSIMSLGSVMITNVIVFTMMERKNILEYIFMTLYFILLKLLSYTIVTWFMFLLAHEVVFPIYYTIDLSDLLLLVFLLCTAKQFKKYLFKIRDYTAFYIAIHIILILLYLSYLVTIFRKGELVIESSIEIILISILVILIYKMINKVLAVEKENNLITLHNEELRFNQKNYDNIITNMNEVKKIKHDMNHMLLSLMEYYDNQQYDELHNCLLKQLNMIHDTNNLINTRNQSLNLILSTHIAKIKKEKIEFISSDFEGDVHIDKIDFYVLLGNLLDNAIENCTSESIKKIILDIYTNGDDLVINIKNTSIQNPLVENPYFSTKKNDSENHGFGMNSIEKIVKKYNGKIVYDYSYNYFLINIELKNE